MAKFVPVDVRAEAEQFGDADLRGRYDRSASQRFWSRVHVGTNLVGPHECIDRSRLRASKPEAGPRVDPAAAARLDALLAQEEAGEVLTAAEEAEVNALLGRLTASC